MSIDTENDINEIDSQSLIPKQINQNNRKIFKCGEEVIYAITFLARIIMTLYSFHGSFLC